MMKMFVKSPAEGAETSIYLASDPGIQGLSAKYWENCDIKQSSGESYEREVGKRLWEVSEELIAAKAAARI